MRSFRKMKRFVLSLLSCVLLLNFTTANVFARDVDTKSEDNGSGEVSNAPMLMSPMLASSSLGQTVQNADGSYTFTQTVDENCSAPYYTQSGWGGFEIYSDAYSDYGWMHDFPDYNIPGLNITSAKLTIVAWDVDSEVYHGWEGEYDGVSVDGVQLNPGYLQGFDSEWSTTIFDIPTSSITDDGVMNMWLDIDMHDYGWLTTLDYSELTINYTLGNEFNAAPYQPVLVPGSNVYDNSDLVLIVMGPTPADPDGDAVTYQYRWFVDIGTTGSFVDDQFAGRGEHTGNTIPAADTQPGDRWQVQVTPVDEHGAAGPYATATWNVVNAAPDTLNFSIYNLATPLNGPTDSAVDSFGNVYVTDYYNNRVVKFSPTGQFLNSYGTVGSGVGQFKKPTGISIDPDNNLYVADTYNNRIVRFSDFDGNGTIDDWQAWTATAEGITFNKPMGVCFNSGRLYIADTYNNRIAVLDLYSSSWSSFGTMGTAAGQFKYPYDVTVDSKYNIWVSDTFNNRVQEFDRSFKYVQQFAASYPYGIAVSQYDNIFVAERMNADIKCVNSSNQVTYGHKGTGAGAFTSPVGVNIDSTGQMWVVDVTAGVIQFAVIP